MANSFFPSDDDDGSGSTSLNLFDGIERFWKRFTGQQSQEDINNAQLAFSQQQLDYQKSIDSFNKSRFTTMAPAHTQALSQCGKPYIV